MPRPWLLCLILVLAGPGSIARAQIIGPGSTPQGDYLRGVGIAAAGMGTYNLRTAQANQIDTETAIRLDMYLSEVYRQARENWNAIDREREARWKENYEKIRDRIRSHPESLDIFTGNALNAALDQLNDPAIHSSSIRSVPVNVPAEMLRKIPFKLDEKGLIFSLRRLKGKGRTSWTVAFQGPDYAPERKAFERAIDRALEQMIEGKLLDGTIAAYDEAVEALAKKLERDPAVGPPDRRYTEARTRLAEMSKAGQVLRTTKAQPIIADIDRYAGKTINDLREFMLAHNLRFASADSDDERRLYVDLYAALDQVRKVVVVKNGKDADQ